MSRPGADVFHATRADSLQRMGRSADAAQACRAALAITTNSAERAFPEQRRQASATPCPGSESIVGDVVELRLIQRLERLAYRDAEVDPMPERRQCQGMKERHRRYGIELLVGHEDDRGTQCGEYIEMVS